MTLIVDAAPLVAAADVMDVNRSAVQRVILSETGAVIVPAVVTAEVDYMLGRRLGRAARLANLSDLAAGRFVVESLDRGEHQMVLDLEHRYADLDAGLADLSIVVLARRFRTTRILTFDQRHFRVLRPIQGGTFRLLPGDDL